VLGDDVIYVLCLYLISLLFLGIDFEFDVGDLFDVLWFLVFYVVEGVLWWLVDFVLGVEFFCWGWL